MEEIKYPTGNFEIDWLLEKPNRALETNSLSEAIKYLIEKHNELVRALAESSNDMSNCIKPAVIKSVCECDKPNTDADRKHGLKLCRNCKMIDSQTVL